MCGTLTQGTVMTDLDVAIAASGHLLHHCLVLSLIFNPVQCDCTCRPEKPAARLCHRVGDLMHPLETQSPCLIANT